jgi:hypothetical protein
VKNTIQELAVAPCAGKTTRQSLCEGERKVVVFEAVVMNVSGGIWLDIGLFTQSPKYYQILFIDY